MNLIDPLKLHVCQTDPYECKCNKLKNCRARRNLFLNPAAKRQNKEFNINKKRKKEKVKKESILSHLNKGLDIPVNYAEHSSFHPYNYSTTFQN